MLRFLVILALALASNPRAGDAAPCPFWAEFNSIENGINGIFQSHTFVRYFHRFENGAIEYVDISFLPHPNYFRQTRRGDKLPLSTVPGMNYSREATFDLAYRNALTVVPNGVHCISALLFERARAQSAMLSSGRVPYRLLDRRTRNHYGLSTPGQAPNCISVQQQLVADLTGPQRHFNLHGSAATHWVIELFAGARQLW